MQQGSGMEDARARRRLISPRSKSKPIRGNSLRDQGVLKYAKASSWHQEQNSRYLGRVFLSAARKNANTNKSMCTFYSYCYQARYQRITKLSSLSACSTCTHRNGNHGLIAVTDAFYRLPHVISAPVINSQTPSIPLAVRNFWPGASGAKGGRYFRSPLLFAKFTHYSLIPQPPLYLPRGAKETVFEGASLFGL